MVSRPSPAPPSLDLSKVKIFTISEANALVPRLELATARMREHLENLIFAHEQLHDLLKIHGTLVRQAGHPHYPEYGALRQQEQEHHAALEREVMALQAEGVEVKDPRTGLVDFYGLRGSQIVYLCWESGEPEVAYWHPLGGGYAARQPIRREEFLGE